jgi:CRISPR/Cas system-associated protein endoribonuclease Cas2
MEMTQAFFNKSIFSEDFHPVFSQKLFGGDENSFTLLMFDEGSAHIRKLTKIIIQVSGNINEHKFQEARVNILSSHKINYASFNSEIIWKYKTIKSLLTGLIYTSSIIQKDSINIYQKKWEYLKKDSNPRAATPNHLQIVYKEFEQIKTMHELLNFNTYFQNYIQYLLFDLAACILVRLKYTYQELKADNNLEAIANTIKNLYCSFSAHVAIAKKKISRI